MKKFVYTPGLSRIVFGPNSIGQLPSELDQIGARRALILCTPYQREQVQAIADLLPGRVAAIFDRAALHVPIEIVRDAKAMAKRVNADCAVAIGGSSTIGLGKVLSLESQLSIIAVPTAYSGSEVLPIYDVTEGGIKKTERDPRVLPRVVIYDPELTLPLPLKLTVASLISAIAHAAEGLYAHDGNPVIALMAEEGIRACASALQSLEDNPQDLSARNLAFYGAWLCGTVLGAVSMALHHQLCHMLGGAFDLPYASVHAAILPHALRYNAAAAPEAMARIAKALGATDASMGVYTLAKRHDVPVSLKEIGMPAGGLDYAAQLAASGDYRNPRPLEKSALRKLLGSAFDGLSPTID